MGEHTKLLFKFDQPVPSTEKKEWESQPTTILNTLASISKVSGPTEGWSKQQTVEVSVTAPDVAALISSWMRRTSFWLHLVAALIIGFNKDVQRNDSGFRHHSYLSKLLTLNIILCLYSLRLWRMGVHTEKRRKPHIMVLPLSSIYVLDQISSYLLIILCFCAWGGIASQNCLATFGQGYCRWTQAGVAISFIGWLFLISPSIITFLRVWGKLRDGLITANATARRHRKPWQ